MGTSQKWMNIDLLTMSSHCSPQVSTVLQAALRKALQSLVDIAVLHKNQQSFHKLLLISVNVQVA